MQSLANVLTLVALLKAQLLVDLRFLALLRNYPVAFT